MPDRVIAQESNRRIEVWTGRVLRLGVWISAILMISGLVLSTANPVPESDGQTPAMPEIASHMLSGSFDPATLMETGLLLLMFTPILRVITTLAGFTYERDWRFAAMAAAVLFMLAAEIVYSLFLK